MCSYAMASRVFMPLALSPLALGGGEEDVPDWMYGALDVWPILEGYLSVLPYVTGDIGCTLHLGGDGEGGIGVSVFVIGDVHIDHHLCGRIEVNR